MQTSTQTEQSVKLSFDYKPQPHHRNDHAETTAVSSFLYELDQLLQRYETKLVNVEGCEFECDIRTTTTTTTHLDNIPF